MADEAFRLEWLFQGVVRSGKSTFEFQHRDQYALCFLIFDWCSRGCGLQRLIL